jgi:hypothetical protein
MHLSGLSLKEGMESPGIGESGNPGIVLNYNNNFGFKLIRREYYSVLVQGQKWSPTWLPSMRILTQNKNSKWRLLI